MKFLNTFFIILLFAGCRFQKNVGPKSSNTIEDSQNRTVFVCNIVPEKDSFKVGDQTINIESSWIENKWKINSNHKEEIDRSKIQFVIKFSEDCLDLGYIKKWTLYLNDYAFGVYGENVLLRKSELLEKDNLTVELKIFDDLKSNSENSQTFIKFTKSR